ncbi:MAG TPA: hypothetical protein VFZ65_12425, partial [Planctomycetota bacterium]|nr:hypothetical protein [Planctomycetota bacterium]
HGSCHATAVWDPDGAGPAPAVLVVGGRFAAGTLVDTSLVAFDGTGWSALGTPPFVGVRALTVWNGLFVAAGSSGLQHAIAIRDGTVWVAGGSAAGINDCTDTMAGFQGDLVRGRSTSVDGVR